MPKAKSPPEPPPDPVQESAEQMFERRRRGAKRAGLGQIDADLFAVGDTPLAILRLCVRRGATPDQIRRICV
jgi:hypothetical protein